MIKTFGAEHVAPPEDIKFSKQHDMLQNWVFERKKQEAKKREALVNHYAPNCRTFTYAQAQYMKRSMSAPYGDPDKHDLPADFQDGTKLAVRTCSLCMIHHQVGDMFTCEHIFPTPMLQMACWKQLCNMPGVFVVTWDNFRFGAKYRHT